MTQNILVVAEAWKGELTDGTFEAVALGRELGDGLGVGLEVALVGSGIAGLADQLGAADTVLLADASEPVETNTDAVCGALVALITDREPAGVLVPLSNVSWDVAGLLPARLGFAYLNACSDLRVVDGGLEATCVLYGGKMEARVRSAGDTAVYGILPGARPADAGRSEGQAAVEKVSVAVETGAIRFREYLEPDAGDVDITQQEVLVAVGRGLQGDANLELAEELAELLGGAVCGSRPAIDQGWLPLSRQVGKSGLQVKPRLYLALGISGAPEHVEGMRDSDLVIAVNTDPDAPIFHTAHYGTTEDLLDVVPELIDRVEETKGG